MKDDFEATFVVDLAPAEVWEALTERTVEGDAGDGAVHYVLPGFPSLPPLDVEGASCRLVECEEARLLRVVKDDHPCQGTEIAVTLEEAGTGTRVTVIQSGFGPFLDIVGRDTAFGHGHQIVADFRLYLERRITVPGTAWGVNLGAKLRQTAVGLDIDGVLPGSLCEQAGLKDGDLLLTLNGIRIHDLQQLWTVLAFAEAGKKAELTWARGRERMEGSATPQ